MRALLLLLLLPPPMQLLLSWSEPASSTRSRSLFMPLPAALTHSLQIDQNSPTMDKPAAASRPLASALHSPFLHLYFFSILAAVIFCFWWVSASLLYFHTATTCIFTSIFTEHCRRSGPDQVVVAHADHHSYMLQVRYNGGYSSRSPAPNPAARDSSSTEAAGSASSSPPWAIPRLSSPPSSSSSSFVSPTSATSVSPHSIARSRPADKEESLFPPSSSSSWSPSSTSVKSQSPSPFLHDQSHETTRPLHAAIDHPRLSRMVPRSSCHGKLVYIHSLPPMFNQDMISNCSHDSPTWADICKISSNEGLGPFLEDRERVLAQPSGGAPLWYDTEQFILDVIFHSRMKRYKCLTNDSSKADLIYVPYYAGLDLTRYLWRANVSVRDYLPNALANWLPEQPEWKFMSGRDHFFVTGKISWDFRRPTEDDMGWGNKLLQLTALKEVSVLVIEKGPTEASDVEHALPYPTYFHPRRDSEIYDWQELMRAKKRLNLFTFAGASRPEIANSIRGELIEQCRVSPFCKLLECSRGKSGCNSPTTVMKLFQESVFCLQPSGDSHTRRSVFDAMVSGCIPVLFHRDTVYTQYNWHLPQNQSTYSVFIPEEEIKSKTTLIEQVLNQIPELQVEEMRKTVISLIPSLIYTHPDHQLEKVKDAFDVAVEALLAKVSAYKKQEKRKREVRLERRIRLENSNFR